MYHGAIERVERNDAWAVTLKFQDTDVLYALTHIPSTGPTTAHINIDDNDNALDIHLQLAGSADAIVSLTDFGAAVRVEPVPGSSR